MILTQLVGLALLFGAAVGLAVLVGRYLSRVFQSKSNPLNFMAPLERLIYRIGGINPTEPMTWRQYAVAMLIINGVWLVYGFVLLLVQADIPIWNQAESTAPAGQHSLDGVDAGPEYRDQFPDQYKSPALFG